MKKHLPKHSDNGKYDLSGFKDLPFAPCDRSDRSKKLFLKVVRLLGERKYSREQLVKKCGTSITTISSIRAECKRAFEKGYKDAREYYDAGRPCSNRNRVIA